MRVCIDPGHGGKDPGACAHGLEEENFNLIIGALVCQQLIERGVVSKMTRAFDESFSDHKSKDLQARCDFADAMNADLFISIHANSVASEQPSGMEVHYYSSSGLTLAANVLQSMVDAFPKQKNRGVKQSSFFVLRKTKMPAILIECGFVTNKQEAELLADEESQVLMATAITQGILKHIEGMSNG